MEEEEEEEEKKGKQSHTVIHLNEHKEGVNAFKNQRVTVCERLKKPTPRIVIWEINDPILLSPLGARGV